MKSSLFIQRWENIMNSVKLALLFKLPILFIIRISLSSHTFRTIRIGESIVSAVECREYAYYRVNPSTQPCSGMFMCARNTKCSTKSWIVKSG